MPYSTLVKEGKIKEDVVDDAVRRILQKKFELGLVQRPIPVQRCGTRKENGHETGTS